MGFLHSSSHDSLHPGRIIGSRYSGQLELIRTQLRVAKTLLQVAISEGVVRPGICVALFTPFLRSFESWQLVIR